jgi:hypothetical protein
MRRIKLVLATLVVLVAAIAAFAGPAMADELNCRDARGDLIRCDGDLYAPYDNTSGYNYPPFSYDYNDYPYNYPPFYSPSYSDFNYADYDDYDDYVDELEDFVDDLEDSSYSYYGW